MEKLRMATVIAISPTERDRGATAIEAVTPWHARA